MTRLRRYVKRNRPLRTAFFLAQYASHGTRSLFARGALAATPAERPPHLLVAMVRVKNEARFLPEWLAHHVNVGVEHFYVYDNNSTDDITSAVEPFTVRGLVTHIPWSTVPVSPSSHIDFLRRFGHTATWCMFLDADEFLIEPSPGDLVEFLASHERWPAVAFNSRYFGIGGHETIPRGLVTEQFTRAQGTYNDHVKVIAQPRAIHAYRNPHSFYYTGWRLARAPDGRRVFGTFIRTADDPRFVVNHYVNRGREDYENKRRRGYATAAGQRARQRRAAWSDIALSKYDDVTVRVPSSITRATGELLSELGYPEELYAPSAQGNLHTG